MSRGKEIIGQFLNADSGLGSDIANAINAELAKQRKVIESLESKASALDALEEENTQLRRLLEVRVVLHSGDDNRTPWCTLCDSPLPHRDTCVLSTEEERKALAELSEEPK